MSDRITIERETLQAALNALEAVDALIEHQFTGKRTAMTALQYVCDDAAVCVPDLRAALAAQPASFQGRVQPWMMECFGAHISADKQERNHRFLEESLELVQACGCTQSEAHQLVDYVYGRPVGDPQQEVGGVMVTLAALCLAQGMDMHAAGEVELARIWTKVEKIRAKQAAKPKHSPLPQAAPPAPAAVPPGYALVPVEPTPEMVAAYLDANTKYWRLVDEQPPKVGIWRNGTPAQATEEAYRAMIAAAGDKP